MRQTNALVEQKSRCLPPCYKNRCCLFLKSAIPISDLALHLKTPCWWGVSPGAIPTPKADSVAGVLPGIYKLVRLTNR